MLLFLPAYSRLKYLFASLLVYNTSNNFASLYKLKSLIGGQRRLPEAVVRPHGVVKHETDGADGHSQDTAVLRALCIDGGEAQ